MTQRSAQKRGWLGMLVLVLVEGVSGCTQAPDPDQPRPCPGDHVCYPLASGRTMVCEVREATGNLQHCEVQP